MLKVSLRSQYQQMKQSLNEKQWRQYLALEVKRKGNITAVATKGDPMTFVKYTTKSVAHLREGYLNLKPVEYTQGIK